MDNLHSAHTLFRAYGSEILHDIITKLETGLENLTSQPVESEKYGDLDTRNNNGALKS